MHTLHAWRHGECRAKARSLLRVPLAVAVCEQVLKLAPNNVKALFLRGKARHALGQADGALLDLEQAHRL